MTVTILRGDCREVLRTLPEKSVHMVATSPPYWSLRDYGTPPLVWGGRDGCAHSWGEETIRRDRGSPAGKNALVNHEPRSGIETHQGQFCHLCGAWRGSLGLEPTPDLYIKHIVEVMREVWRVLRDDGTAWLNLADSMAKQPFEPWGLKVKDECGIPDEVKRALRMDGWYIRKSIVWAKGVSFCKAYSGSCMPESVKDRPTNSYEMVFLLSKRARYFYDQEAVKESSSGLSGGKFGVSDVTITGRRDTGNPRPADNGTRNLRSVWLINPGGSSRKHYAAYPEALVRPMILAGTSAYGVCPKCGAPFERVTTTTHSQEGITWEQRKVAGESTRRVYSRNRPVEAGGSMASPITETIDWRPTCGHFINPVLKSGGRMMVQWEDPMTQMRAIPATVLDLFSGSGTTCHVAESLGRNSIGIDLSGDYCEMARRRVNRTEETETVLNGQAVTVEQVPMWEWWLDDTQTTLENRI